MKLKYESATITWKPSKNIKTVKNATIYEQDSHSYRISWDEYKNGQLVVSHLGKRIWKKSVIDIIENNNDNIKTDYDHIRE